MIKDFRYITKRVIIGILIGLFFIVFKSCNVHALYIEGATTNVYFETQNCQLNDNVFNCNKGTSYKFVYEENTTNNDTTFFPFILNNSENYVFFKNMIMNISFANSVTIDSTNRSIGYNFSSGNYISGETNTYGSLYFVPKFMDSYGIGSNNLRDNRLMSYSTYAFKPYYASYIDSNDVEHTCGIIYEHASATTGWFTIVFDIPLNTQVKGLKLYLGNYKFNSTYNAVTLIPNIKVPSGNFAYYDSNIADRTNLYYYGRLYNTYRTTDNDHNNEGLLFLQKGVNYYQPKFNVNNNAHSLQTFSNSYSSNTYKYYFTNLSNEDLSSIQNSIPRIEEELEEQQEEDVYEEDWFYNSYDNFTSNYAQGFVGLFNSLFVKPIALITEQTEIDLVKDGGNGKVLNNLICTRNSGRDNIIGDYNPYSIELPFGYSFNLPCPHTDIYPLLKKRGYGFYGNNFLGANITSGVTYSFADIWLTLQHGLLIYFLFVTELNFIKYLLDPSKSEVEVLEL